MTDGQESVSSISVLESDNIELINRIADLQRHHGEALHKVRFLRLAMIINCFFRLAYSNPLISHSVRRTKKRTWFVHLYICCFLLYIVVSQVIEEWVRSRPLPSTSQRGSSSSTTPRGFAGTLLLIFYGQALTCFMIRSSQIDRNAWERGC